MIRGFLHKPVLGALAVLHLSVSHVAFANSGASKEERFDALAHEVEQLGEHVSMDTLFTYAKLSAKLGKNQEAISAYARMLERKPSLERVKLDLALLYARTEQFEKAKPLFEEVLANPSVPDSVRKNIDSVMLAVDKGLKKHTFNGSATIGWNYETNANAVPSSGAVSVSVFEDNQLQLTNTESKDGQVFATVTQGHEYKISSWSSDELKSSWYSTGTIYATEQAKQSQLEILVLAAKTGPTFKFKNYDTELSLLAGATHVEVDKKEYLNAMSAEMLVKHTLNPKTQVTLSGLFERKFFKNTAEVLSQSARSGQAGQIILGLRHVLHPQHLVNSSVMYRRENTRRDFYDYNRYEWNGGYTYVIRPDIFMNSGVKTAYTKYDGADDFIDPDTVRSEKEYLANVMLGKTFDKKYTATIGYQYKYVASPIQNYEYKNHRFLSSVGVRW